MNDAFEIARLKYKPDHIKCLFVVESPPKEESGRFFYFEDVRTKDSLFLEIVKVLYPEQFISVESVRALKEQLLNQFKSDGYYLIDAVDYSIAGLSPHLKRKHIQHALSNLIKTIRELNIGNTPIILITAPVYAVCNSALREAGFNVVNTEMIDYPGYGGQARFREKLHRVLSSLR